MLAFCVDGGFKQVGVIYARYLDRVLKTKKNTLASALLGFEIQQVLAEELDGTLVHFIIFVPGNDQGKRALAGSVGTHDRVHFAGLHA